MRIYRFLFIDNQPTVEVTCREVVYRDGFFECINADGVAIAFYRSEIIKGIDSNRV